MEKEKHLFQAAPDLVLQNNSGISDVSDLLMTEVCR